MAVREVRLGTIAWQWPAVSRPPSSPPASALSGMPEERRVPFLPLRHQFLAATRSGSFSRRLLTTPDPACPPSTPTRLPGPHTDLASPALHHGPPLRVKRLTVGARRSLCLSRPRRQRIAAAAIAAPPGSGCAERAGPTGRGRHHKRMRARPRLQGPPVPPPIPAPPRTYRVALGQFRDLVWVAVGLQLCRLPQCLDGRRLPCPIGCPVKRAIRAAWLRRGLRHFVNTTFACPRRRWKARGT